MDLIHVLFGTVLGLDDAALLLVTSASSITLLVLAVIFRPLVLECLDPLFLRSHGSTGSFIHMVFLVLLVMTLVAGFQVLGTLMVVGIMMLPEIGRAHVCTPVTNAHLVCRLLLEK